MKRFPVRLALILGLAAGVAAIPIAASAQNPQQGKSAPVRGGGGAHPGGGGHAGGGGGRPAAAPHISAPHFSAPHAVQRTAPASRRSFSRAAPASHPSFSRAVRQQRSVQRATRQARPSAAAVQTRAATRTQQRAVQRAQRTQPKAAVAPQIKSQAQMQGAATPAQKRAATRTQQRAERALRRSENRALRNTPASQRAAKREEINRARRQRAQQRQQATPNAATAQPNAAARTTAQTRVQRRAARLAARGITPVTAQAARQGRFAARFGNANARARRGHYAARRAWRQGLRAAFVPWFGPVFWPYAYSDIFDYAFWPYGYDEGFWDYAYDDFVDSLFWGEEGPPADYVYAEPGADTYATPAPTARYAAVEELCKQPGTGITAWPFADIEKKVGLNADQKDLLNGVRSAANDAAASFKASCPAENAFPLTPPGRLTAMTARLQATLRAVQTVRPALEKFYNSLSDEQKERFNQLGPKQGTTSAEAKAALPADTKSCTEAKPGLSNLPIERIGDAIDPTDEQEPKLTALKDATDKAVSILQAACPDETPITPPGRLEAMEKRLQAMIDAANTVKPALTDFYASLTNEQKARFNEIGKEMAQTTG